MSFKLFYYQLSGKIKSAEVVEKQFKMLENAYNEYLKVEKSEELKVFLELERIVSSGEFKNRKKETEALRYKGSEEYNIVSEFEKLKNSVAIRNYFKLKESSELAKFEKIRLSEKLDEYNKLNEYVTEGQFKKDKTEILSQVFKGSVEEKHQKDFKLLSATSAMKSYLKIQDSAELKKHRQFSSSEKLKKYLDFKNSTVKEAEKHKEFGRMKADPEIKVWFGFENSKDYRLYLETLDSQDLKKFNELKKYVESNEFKSRELFLKDKSKFEKSDSFKKYQKYKSLASDTDIRFFQNFEKSKLYKNYLDTKESFKLKRFFELKEKVTSKEFGEKKAYLLDLKRWDKSEDAIKQFKYNELKSKPHIANYLKVKGSKDYDFFRKWEISFFDGFNTDRLNSEKWSVTTSVADKTLGENYALPGDIHFFTNGKNIKTGNKLAIEVRQEKTRGKRWQMPAGFIPVELNYTSGMISSWKSFNQLDGIFEAKVKINRLNEIVSTVSLSGENDSPAIHLVEMGTKNRIGVSTLDPKGKIAMEGIDISNLKNGAYYLFSVEKNGSKLTWKINGTEVFSAERNDFKFPLHLNAKSMVVYDVAGSKLPYRFEIDWIRCYKRKAE